MARGKLSASQVATLKVFAKQPNDWIGSYMAHKSSLQSLHQRSLLEAHGDNTSKLYTYSTKFRITQQGLDALKGVDEAPRPKASLNEAQRHCLEQFRSHADDMQQSGYEGWMYARSGVGVPYKDRMNLATVTALVTRGCLEKQVARYSDARYKITDLGREALKEQDESAKDAQELGPA